MTNTATNVAAVAAVIKESGGSMALPIAVSSRRNTSSKSAAARAAIVGSLPSPPASLPSHRFHLDTKRDIHESAIEDDPNDMSADEPEDENQKARIRRASDGQPLMKEGKRSSRIELKCEKCGKGYKHSSCLTKHLFVANFLLYLTPTCILYLCWEAVCKQTWKGGSGPFNILLHSVGYDIDLYLFSSGGNILPSGL
jgi:hypothetical protein